MTKVLHVLLVEDTQTDADYITFLLKKEGYDLTLVRVDTPEAMEHALKTGAWDVIISDYKMPHFSGPEALALARKMDMDLPFIVVSSTVGEDVAVEMMKVGAHDFIPKTNMTRLFPAIERELAQVKVRAERRQAEGRFRFFALAVEKSSDAIGMSTPDGKHYYQNKAFDDLFGVVGENPPATLYVDEQVGREVFRTIMGGHPWNGEVRMRGKAGELLDVLLRAYAIKDNTQRIVGLVGVHTDITERKRSEETLRDSEARYRALFQGTADGILIADLESRMFRYANPAACRLLGYSEVELQTMGVADIHPKADLPAVLAEFEAQARGDKILAAGLPCLRKDGTIVYADVNAVAMIIDGRKCNVGFFRDITEQKRLEIELTHARKLESVGQLAAGIAHEINTPTQFVGDNTQFLKDAFANLLKLIAEYRQLQVVFAEGRSDPALSARMEQAVAVADLDYLMREIPKAIDQSLEGLQRISRIVRAMKDFSHPGGSEKEPANLNQAIETTVMVARNEWKYVADLETDLDANLHPFPCFVGEMNQVFLNLIVNAAHAIEASGVKESGKKGTIRVSTRRDDDVVEIRISDSGIGIAPEHRARIFEPFFTTKVVGKGTGQGLALAYQVVARRHGGTIAFETEVGKGTTFIMRLPLGQEK